ncbi:MAG: hypothetical protein WAN14_21615 [Candidatus Acidiferrales bacterium]
MKKFRTSRDNGSFALNTLQNPNLEVRSLSQLIAAAQQIVEEEARTAGVPLPDASLSNDAPPPVDAALPEEEQPGLEDDAAYPLSRAADKSLTEAPPILTESPAACPPGREAAAPPQNPAPAPKTSLAPSDSPVPQRRAVRKTLARKRARPSPKKSAHHQPRPRAPRRELTDLERHERKCVICQHPYRDAIDDYFMQWYPPHRIAEEFLIPKVRCIYRHAHATGLMQQRRLAVRDSLEYIVERAYDVTPSAEAVIQAVQACSRINAQGEWVDPPRRVIFSSEVNRRPTNGPATLELPENLPKLPPAIDLQPVISNRHTVRLENAISHSKQTTAPSSNRHFFTHLARKIRAFLNA